MDTRLHKEAGIGMGIKNNNFMKFKDVFGFGMFLNIKTEMFRGREMVIIRIFYVYI